MHCLELDSYNFLEIYLSPHIINKEAHNMLLWWNNTKNKKLLKLKQKEYTGLLDLKWKDTRAVLK